MRVNTRKSPLWINLVAVRNGRSGPQSLSTGAGRLVQVWAELANEFVP
jgi:hypothetical protein